MSTFFSAFHPAEVTGAKGSAAFLGSITSALVYLYKRSASAPAGPNNNTVYTFATANVDVSAITNGWTATIPVGTDPLYVVAASAVGTNATDTIPNTEWSSPVLLVQNGTNGTNGLNNAVVYIYRRSASAPTLPSATATYTFATGGITGLNNSWTATVPAGTDPLYVALATASSTSTTDTIAAGEWTTPQILAQNGTSGTSGLSVASVFLYKRATSTPALPTTTSTFTFATGVLTGHDGGWTQAVPAGTDPIYITTATASSTGATDTIPNTEWAAAQIFAQNGSNGTNGLNSATVYLYQRNDTGTAPSVPSTTSTYTFATAVLTGYNNGWAQTVPGSSSGKYLFVTTATAASTSTTDTIATGEWSSPTIMAEVGDMGLTVYLTNETFSIPATSNGTVLNYGGNVYPYVYDSSTTAADPGAGKLRFNNATKASATAIYLDDVTSGAVDIQTYLTSVDASTYSVKGTIRVYLTSDPTKYEVYNITDLTENTGYWTLTVAHVVGTAYAFTNLDPITIAITLTASNGASGRFIVLNTETNTDVSASFTLSTVSNAQTLSVNYVNNTYTIRDGLDPTEVEGILMIRATGSGAWTGTTIDKSFTLSKAIQGQEAISGYITNESAMVFTYADGTPVDFNGANGYLKVFNGVVDVTSSATSFSATASGCTGTINTADNTPVSGQVKGYYRITAMSSDTATLTLSATYGGVTITKVFALTKAKAGYEIVGTLPATNLFAGRTVFLTSDNKLYRYTGSAWTTAVPAVDITGTITTTQITDDAITTAKIAANAVTAAEIAADTITANQIAAGAITANEISAGTITAAEIASNTITAVKLNISSLSAITATIGLLRTATSGARMEIENNVIRVYDTSGTLRVKIGNLA